MLPMKWTIGRWCKRFHRTLVHLYFGTRRDARAKKQAPGGACEVGSVVVLLRSQASPSRVFSVSPVTPVSVTRLTVPLPVVMVTVVLLPSSTSPRLPPVLAEQLPGRQTSSAAEADTASDAAAESRVNAATALADVN